MLLLLYSVFLQWLQVLILILTTVALFLLWYFLSMYISFICPCTKINILFSLRHTQEAVLRVPAISLSEQGSGRRWINPWEVRRTGKVNQRRDFIRYKQSKGKQNVGKPTFFLKFESKLKVRLSFWVEVWFSTLSKPECPSLTQIPSPLDASAALRACKECGKPPLPPR